MRGLDQRKRYICLSLGGSGRYLDADAAILVIRELVGVFSAIDCYEQTDIVGGQETLGTRSSPQEIHQILWAGKMLIQNQCKMVFLSRSVLSKLKTRMYS